MNNGLDVKRLGIFLALAFGLAWIIGLVIFLTGGLVNSPVLVPQLQLTLAVVLLAVGYMWAPALAHVLTRLLTREGWQDTWLRPHFKRGWRYWLAAWVVPALATIVGAAVFFALLPRYFDPDLTMLRGMLAQNAQTATMNPWLIVAAQLGSAVLIAPLLNGLFTFGEEFGWRGYLLPKLLPKLERSAASAGTAAATARLPTGGLLVPLSSRTGMQTRPSVRDGRRQEGQHLPRRR